MPAGGPGWLFGLGVRRAGNAFEAEMQMANARQVAALWPAAMHAQFCIAILLIAASLVAGMSSDGFAVSLLTCTMLGSSLLIRWAMRSRRFWKLDPLRQTALCVPAMGAMGGVTMLLAAESLRLPYPELAMLLAAAVGVSALFVLLALMTMPLAAFAYAAAGAVALIAATGHVALAGSAMIMLACFAVAIVARARFDHYVSWRRQQLESNGHRANRLLAQFEAGGQGWFWETDRAGNLVYMSARMIAQFGEPREMLIGRPLNSLILAEGGAEDGGRTLAFHFSARSRFSEVTVRAALPDRECWWSLSGRPVIDKIGQFRGFSGTGTDLTERRRSQDEVKRLARYDSLTGLANRQHMRTMLDEGLGAAQGAKPIVLLLLDLDRFKQVNDTMGHPVGDALLKQVGVRLFSAVGDRGMVGRIGGDEFQVILPDVHRKGEAEELARAIIAALSEPYMIDGVGLTIGCSIGIAKAPDHGRKSEELIRNADLALYAAKADGRGVFRVYQSEMHAGAKKRKRLEDDIRQALANDEFYLTYQPIVSTADAQIVGFESLIRWEHPGHGAISPADFIPVAEDIRLIEKIGIWVLQKACQDAASWPLPVRVAVNVSPIQFANPALPKLVTAAIAAANLRPERLELEITESVFLDDGSDTDAMFKALKQLGVRLALDDFGTGYSSLGYLKSAPFDKIKIDQSFIRGAAVAGNRNAAIIKAIVTLADTLYMETTAEGAEMEDEIALIRDLGCSHIQGYIYGKPMRHEEVCALLRAGGGKAIASGFKASRSPRSRMLRSSTLDVSGKESRIVIRDISATGALIDGIGNLAADTDVLIELLEDQMFPARVRWSNEGRAGVEFARSFDLERLNAPAPKPARKAASG